MTAGRDWSDGATSPGKSGLFGATRSGKEAWKEPTLQRPDLDFWPPEGEDNTRPFFKPPHPASGHGPL